MLSKKELEERRKKAIEKIKKADEEELKANPLKLAPDDVENPVEHGIQEH